ncbi:hypothetical protein DSL72_007416 [Monilinia vaccinii-corymbosi]|uniref:ERCC4 domain-containing protein n=1 Tax=Monilinia vaccinii-corymbosi TaxID=61207 RepID=A0A8A3PMD4_9HELO|nr:hypothetical protein DSL72_007416 [Monilinia vaccinii-corymbosi]
MQEFVDLTSPTPSPEPELPKAHAKVASNCKHPLKDASQNAPRPPTVQHFDYSFANLDNATSAGTVEATAPKATLKHSQPKANKAIEIDDGDSIQLWSDEFDTTIDSMPNGTSAKNTGSSKHVELISSDDPFTSPPPAKRRKESPPKDKAPRLTDGYKRTVSNIESVVGGNPKQYMYSLKRSKSMGADPILFTSSPDVSAIRSRNGEGKAPSRPYVDVDEDEAIGVPRKKASMPDPVELEDSDEFPSIENLKSWNPIPKKAKRPEEPMAHYDDEDSCPEKKKREKPKDKALSAAEKKAAKDAEKEQKRIDKERAKAEKEQEKERAKELAKANIDRTKPEISAPEMIVDLPSCIQDKSNKVLRDRIDSQLTALSVEQSRWENSELVIKWRRKVISEYSQESNIWEPKPLQIKDEKHILCVLPAKKFVNMVLRRGDEDLDTHVSILKAQFESCKLIYLIEGLTAWQNKNRTIKDRQYKAAVRSRIPEDEAASASSQRRRAAQADEYVEKADDAIEDELLNLEVVHKVRYWLTINAQDSAKWISQFTKHISTIPYLAQCEVLGLNSCMASGQYKSGKDATDTYVKMLEEIHHVTEKMAEGIVAEYPTPQALLKGFKEGGPLAIKGCRKLGNKNGAWNDVEIGKAISRRVYKVFTEEDPDCCDV